MNRAESQEWGTGWAHLLRLDSFKGEVLGALSLADIRYAVFYGIMLCLHDVADRGGCSGAASDLVEFPRRQFFLYLTCIDLWNLRVFVRFVVQFVAHFERL